jgi:hypothetical protein
MYTTALRNNPRFRVRNFSGLRQLRRCCPKGGGAMRVKKMPRLSRIVLEQLLFG